jgi:hypothetical protein
MIDIDNSCSAWMSRRRHLQIPKLANLNGKPRG